MPPWNYFVHWAVNSFAINIKIEFETNEVKPPPTIFLRENEEAYLFCRHNKLGWRCLGLSPMYATIPSRHYISNALIDLPVFCKLNKIRPYSPKLAQQCFFFK